MSYGNPLSTADLLELSSSNPLHPRDGSPAVVYMPEGYFFCTPPDVSGPAAWRLLDGQHISTGVIDVDRLGSGADGLGTKFLADDGTWQTVVSGGGTWGTIGGAIGDQTDLVSALSAKQDVLSVSANTGLALASDVLSTIYNTTIGDSVMSMAVGGATAQPASFWKTKTIVGALDEIIFPNISATTTPKSVVLTVSGSSGTLEVGQSISRTLTATFNQGQITNGSGTLGPVLVGASTSYVFTGTGISSTSQAGNTLAITNVVVSGSNNWLVTVNHATGSGAYYDNKGVAGTNLDASRVSGSTSDSASAPTITGVLPYFYLKSSSPITAADMVAAINAGTATKVVASSTGTLSIPYNLSAQYIAVAYPNASTTKTIYYVTALDNGSILAVFNAVQVLAATSPLGYWTGENYKIHTSLSAITNSNPTLELRNS